MPRYLVSGKDHRGQKVTEVVTAPSTDEAVRQFVARGFEEIELHSDEVQGHLFDPGAAGQLAPKDLLALGRFSRTQFVWWLIKRHYQHYWWLFGIVIALVAGRRFLERPWEFVDTAAVAILAWPIVFVFLNEIFSAARRVERVMALSAWGRWAEMLAALPAAQRSLQPIHYAFSEAKALAGLGRLDEALDKVRPYADDPETPAWLYWGQLSDVFSAAGLGARVVDCSQKAVENAPNNVTVLIDAAMGLLRYQRDVDRARPLLERARRHEVSDVIMPFLIMGEGVLALEEKKPHPARRQLEEALNMVQPFRHTTALMGTAIDRMHAYLAIACAEAGDVPAAEAHYRVALPRLEAFNTQDMIERCERALGRR